MKKRLLKKLLILFFFYESIASVTHAQAVRSVYYVKDFGAKGDGKTPDE